MTQRRPSPALRKTLEKHRRAAYQEGILQAATAVFGRRGFTDAKMSDVAAEAGVSVGTLYNYFENKDALISALIESHHATFCEHIAPVEDLADPVERIRKIVELSFRFLDDRSELIAMAVRAGVFQAHVAAELSGDADMSAHDLVQSMLRSALAQAAAAGTIRADLAPAQLALVIDGVVSGLVHEWVRTGRPQPLSPMAAFVMEVFLKGVQPR